MRTTKILLLLLLAVPGVAVAESVVTDKAVPTQITYQELSGEWFGETVVRGLKAKQEQDPLSQEFLLDISTKVTVFFDQSPEAASQFRQIRIIQHIDHDKGGGKKGVAAKLTDSNEGDIVSVVFHYSENGTDEIRSRTIGELFRNGSGELFLSILPPESGMFDIGMEDFVPVKKIKLTKVSQE